MSLFTMKSEFDRLKTKAYKETDFSENPGYFGSIGSFFTSIAASLRFIFTEKKILYLRFYNGLLLLWFILFGHKVCLGYPKKYGKMTQKTQPQT